MTAAALQDFLIALHPPGSGLIELRALPSKRRRFINATDTDAIQRFLQAHANENVYVSVAARKDATSGTLANCAELHAIFADIDFKSDVHPNGIPESEGRARIKRFPLQPSIVVHSGGGLHGYYLLREPLDLQDPEDCARAKNLLRRLALALGGDLSSAEPARVLRVPGTLNRKYDPPRRVLAESFASELSYNPCDFDDFLPEEPTANGNGHHERFTVPEAIREGERNDTMFRSARSMRAKGFSFEAILAALRAENKMKCEAPLDDAEVAEIAHKAYTQADRREFTTNGNGGATMPPAGSTVDVHLTDLGNAKRFITQHGPDLRFITLWDRWLYWDGTRWRVDDTGEVYRRAMATVTRMYEEAAGDTDEESRKAKAKHALRSEAVGRVKAMVTLAQSAVEIAITPRQLDQCPWLLNCQNGTVDLKTGELRPHRREDLITKSTGVIFDPDTPCPLWEDFLDRVMDGNQSLIDYLQRLSGYALSGDVSEHGFDLAYGGGANGKTSLLNTLLAVLGDYGKIAAPGLLLRKHSNDHPTQIADLFGARMVTSVEFEEGGRFNEALVKQLTGGDRVKARWMRADFFEFEPTWKLIIGTNHRPVIRGSDHAIWRRVRLIPFTVTIPHAEQDKRLVEKLKREELSGILAWAVRGCLEWQQQGLNPPCEVQAATDEYRRDMDILGDFLDACCVVTPAAQVTAKALYEHYAEWCKESGEHAVSQKRLGTALVERGFARRKTNQGHCWFGLQLCSEAEWTGTP